MNEQVQIKVIELAWKYAEGANRQTGKYADKTTLEVFDIAYKALSKTVTET